VNPHLVAQEPRGTDFASTTPVEISIPTQSLTLPTAGAPNPLVRTKVHAEVGQYLLRMAESVEDRDAACRLRFKVFNLELGEGLESSYATGMDTDGFDLFCEHLLVEEKLTRRIVGTYRMQTGSAAARNVGYYSAQEFNLDPYEPLRAGILELGRASIDCEHRTPEVLILLWRGIAQYATDMGLRYLIGCSSLNSRDPQEGWQMYRQLEQYRVSPEFETRPTERFQCPVEQDGPSAQQEGRQESDPLRTHNLVTVKIPKLMKTYLALGARIAAEPAWDREFGTIDFLTLLDLKQILPGARNRFLAPLTQ